MSHPEEEELSSPTDVSTHVPASPREGDTFFYHLSGFGLKPTAKPQKEASGAMRFSTSFATAWFCAACSGAHFGDPHSDFCLTPLQTRSRRRTQLAHGSVTPSWHGGTGHTSAFALGDWGLVPLPVEVGAMDRGCSERSTAGGSELTPWKLSASQWDMPPRQSSDPAFPKRQGSAQHRRGQKIITSTLQASKGNSRWGSLLWLCRSNLAHPKLLPGARTRPQSPQAPAAPRCLPSTSPWCSTQDTGQTAAQTRSKASYTP